MNFAQQQTYEENPFQFELDSKKFLQKLEKERNSGYNDDDEEQKQVPHTQKLYQTSAKSTRFGLLQKLEDQTNKLAQERDEMFVNEAKMRDPNQPQKIDEIAQHIKHFNPKLMEYRDDEARKTIYGKEDKKKDYELQEMKKKKYRIKSILREKRETITDFIEKKREICLANLNIMTKKEETERLEDFIKNEQESLRARRLYFKNDCELVKKFMNEVKFQADQAAYQADREAKKKDEVKTEVAKILAQIDRLKLQKTKYGEEFEKLDKYRQFLEKIKDTYKTKFSEFEKKDINLFSNQQSEQKNQFFVTGVDQREEQKQTQEQIEAERQQERMADLVIEILNNIEEGNLRNIQNQRDAEEDIEQKKRELEKLEQKLKNEQDEHLEMLKAEERKLKAQLKIQNQLKDQEKVDQTKLQFAEGEDLDMDKIGKKIIEIQQEATKNQDIMGKRLQIDSKVIKQVINQLEKIVIDLSESKLQFLLRSKTDFIEAEKKIKKEKQQQRLNNQKDEEKKKQIMERRNKKEEHLQKFYKGRHDMKRNYKQEKPVVETEETETDQNDDEKYLRESYELVYVPPQQKSHNQQQSNELNIKQNDRQQ
ncbi:unnamed protein product (macronuclear) [Paramecium tetraurelia]|uniref:DUF4200 domain-containing protein n=1 Tax=Paramecium tetraurelia TaxID=5888 RepID=A0EGX2_PARTE|nr:uncharacterized protein GSPATT00026887001 [Paramecium tetraurelia]CAK94563.1 unnamed protein product [Paramecium tetraurelia]|eukprot:XP_001461936.1 hypothetical protein (macronuclear) [Paramecium tetraurelia strain d4-2]